jgi:drug/metabolite transporter (DMT)-like permease
VSGATRDPTTPLMLGLVTVWGTAFVALKVLGEALDPYQLTWFRFAPFIGLYGAWLLLFRRKTFRAVAGNDWVRFALLGFVGVIGYHFTLNWGLHGSSATAVSAATGAILVATVPLFTLLIATLQGQERWNRKAALGSALAFTGVVVVSLMGRGEADLTLAGRTLIILVAPASWALYSVFTKPLVAKYGGLFVTGVSLSLGALTMLPLGIGYGLAPLAGFQAQHWFWLAFLAVLSTVAGYAVWNQALKRRAASQVAVFIYLQPVITAIAAYFILHDHLTPWFLAGAVFVMAGIVIVNKARVQPVAPPAKVATA